LPTTVTNKGSRVAKGLVHNLIKKYERGEICQNIFPNLVTDTKKKCDVGMDSFW